MPTYYDRYYIVPAADRPHPVNNTTTQYPKYTDRSGVIGYSGTLIEESALQDHYPALVQIYPGQEWYLVRIYGTWNELNGISVLGDTRNLATNAHDIGPVLRQRFTDLPDRDDSEWTEAFKITIA